jgi:hypothetical protein
MVVRFVVEGGDETLLFLKKKKQKDFYPDFLEWQRR